MLDFYANPFTGYIILNAAVKNIAALKSFNSYGKLVIDRLIYTYDRIEVNDLSPV